jgi:hypothetical protein
LAAGLAADMRLWHRKRRGDSLDLLEDIRVLDNAQGLEFIRSPVLVKDSVCVLLQLLHVCANEHLPKFDEIAVVFVVNLGNSPRIGTAPNSASIRSLDLAVRTDNSEGDFALQKACEMARCKTEQTYGNLFVLSDCLLVFIFVAWGREDLDVMESDIGENLMDFR